MLSKKKIFLITAVTALAVRLLFAWLVSGSFFDSYHLVPGLDMQTLLRYSEWTGEDPYPPFFTFHRLIIFLCRLFNSQEHSVWAVFAIQAAVGIAGCICLTDIILKLTGKRRAALICGIAYAIYLPTLVYEFSILKETFAVNFVLFAFWAMLHALRKRFSWSSSLLFGFAAFCSIEGRLAILPFLGMAGIYCAYKMFKRKQIGKIFRAAILPVVLLLAVCIFNKSCGWQFSPFFNVLNYTISYNVNAAEAVSTTVADTSPESGIWITVKQAAAKVPLLFKHGELPENQNIYFWCEKIPELNILLAPGVVIPLAAAGSMVLIFSGAWKKRYGLLLLPVVMLALPLCAREPIGRYRLMLIPYFFMIITCAVVVFRSLKQPRLRGGVLLAAGIGAFFSIHEGEVPQRIRPHDYSAYAMAMEYSGECQNPEEFLDEYLNYYLGNPASEYAFCMLMDKLVLYGKNDHALYISFTPEALQINPDLLCFYRALCYAEKGSPEDTEFHLRQIRDVRSLPRAAYKNAFMLRDWADEALKNRNR